MRKLKCFFLMLVLSFSLLSSSVVFAAETEIEVSPFDRSNIKLSSLSDEDASFVRDSFRSGTPYFGFIKKSGAVNPYSFHVSFNPSSVSASSEGNDPSRPAIQFNFSTPVFSLSVFNNGNCSVSHNSSGSYSTLSDFSCVFASSPDLISDFDIVLTDGSHFSNSDFENSYPYGVNLRDTDGNLFGYLEPYGVSVPAATGITVDSLPSKTMYQDGESLEISDISISVHRDDGTFEIIPFSQFPIRNISVSPADGDSLSYPTNSVSVSYKGFTADIPITVSRPPVSSISAASSPSKTTYCLGETLDLSGVSLSVSFDNGKQEIIPFSDFDDKGVIASPVHGAILSAETEKVILSYEGYEASIPISVLPVMDSGVILADIQGSVRSLRDSVSLVVYGILPVAVAILAIFIFLRWFTRTFIHSVIH